MPSMVSETQFAAVFSAGMVGQPAIVSSQEKGARDDFFWLAQMNMAGLVNNSQEGPLDPDIARGIAEALRE